MIDLQKEAEQYAKRFQNDSGYDGESCAIEDRIEMEAFIAGAQSKYVQAEKLKAQIEVLELIKREYNHDEAMIFWINNEIAFLNKYLSKLENEND